MGRNRQTKIIAIIALVVAIAGMSLGFAAFSTTLNISSSASVTPDSSTFSVGFYNTTTTLLAPADDSRYITPTTSGGASAADVYVADGSTSISGLEAKFTAPGGSVTYSFYVGNSGEYDAYLRAINFANAANASTNKVCTAGTDTTDSLVQAACDDIVLTVNVHDISASASNTNISGKVLTKKTFTPITVTIEYLSTGDRADGDFSVSFGDISLDYSSADSSDSLLLFTVKSTAYYYEEGMTWLEWLKSSYNDNNSYYGEDVDCICFGGSGGSLCSGNYDNAITGNEDFSNGTCPT